MALLFMDGFDHYATADLANKYTTVSNVGSGSVINASAGRRGGGAYTAKNSSYATKRIAAGVATLIAGSAVNTQGFGNGASTSTIRFVDSTVVHVSIRLESDGSIKAYRGDVTTLLGSSATGIVNLGGYNYIEVKATINDTTGAVVVRLNGATVLTLSNVDTRNAGNASTDGVGIGGSFGTNNEAFFDDFYICDTAGSTNNDFLGDCRVDTLYPNGDGNYSQFTPSTGSSHYQLVDETAPNTTDYNDGANVGDRDSYAMGNLAALASQTVYGVQVNAALMKDDAGGKSASTFVRSGSTDGDGASVALGTSQVYVSQVYETNPDGAVAWTETAVNAMEAGVRVTA